LQVRMWLGSRCSIVGVVVKHGVALYFAFVEIKHS